LDVEEGIIVLKKRDRTQSEANNPQGGVIAKREGIWGEMGRKKKTYQMLKKERVRGVVRTVRRRENGVK